MHHHGEVDVVKAPLGNDLLLAAQEPELSFLSEAAAVVDLDILFGRNREENDVASEELHRARFLQRACNGEHVRDLHVVTAAVRGARDRVARLVLPADDGVEFAQERNGSRGIRALQARLHTRVAPAVLMRDAERVESRLHLGRRLHFLEAEFGFGKDGVAERLGLGKIFADGFADALLQLFLVHGWTP